MVCTQTTARHPTASSAHPAIKTMLLRSIGQHGCHRLGVVKEGPQVGAPDLKDDARQHTRGVPLHSRVR